MAPLVRRTWGASGTDSGTSSRAAIVAPCEEVSIAAALWLSPCRDRWGLYSKTLVNGYFDNRYVTAFLEAMMHDLDGRFVVAWDGARCPKEIRSTDRRTASPTAFALSPCHLGAPMLNPTEPLWGWLKV